MKLNRRQLRKLIYEVAGLQEASSSLSDEELYMFIDAVYGGESFRGIPQSEMVRIAHNLKQVKDESKSKIKVVLKMFNAMGKPKDFMSRAGDDDVVKLTMQALESELPILKNLR